jgi:hypothetical protein
MDEMKPRIALWRRVRAWAIVALVYGVFVGMAAGAVRLVWAAVRPGVGLEDRIFYAMMACGLLVAPGLLVWGFLKRKWKSGRWGMTREESAQTMAVCRVRAQGQGRMSAPPWAWVEYAAGWGVWAAFEAGVPGRQRVAGWGVLVGFGVLLLGITAIGVVFSGAGLDTFWRLGWLLALFGVALFVFPVRAVMFLVRRRRERGSVGLSRAELGVMGEQRRTWRVREWEKPLRTKILTTAFMILFLGLWWARALLHSSHGHRDGWVTPAMWTVFGVYGVWVQFRRPRAVEAQG